VSLEQRWWSVRSPAGGAASVQRCEGDTAALSSAFIRACDNVINMTAAPDAALSALTAALCPPAGSLELHPLCFAMLQLYTAAGKEAAAQALRDDPPPPLSLTHVAAGASSKTDAQAPPAWMRGYTRWMAASSLACVLFGVGTGFSQSLYMRGDSGALQAAASRWRLLASQLCSTAFALLELLGAIANAPPGQDPLAGNASCWARVPPLSEAVSIAQRAGASAVEGNSVLAIAERAVFQGLQLLLHAASDELPEQTVALRERCMPCLAAEVGSLGDADLHECLRLPGMRQVILEAQALCPSALADANAGRVLWVLCALCTLSSGFAVRTCRLACSDSSEVVEMCRFAMFAKLPYAAAGAMRAAVLAGFEQGLGV